MSKKWSAATTYVYDNANYYVYDNANYCTEITFLDACDYNSMVRYMMRCKRCGFKWQQNGVRYTDVQKEQYIHTNLKHPNEKWSATKIEPKGGHKKKIVKKTKAKKTKKVQPVQPLAPPATRRILG